MEIMRNIISAYIIIGVALTFVVSERFKEMNDGRDMTLIQMIQTAIMWPLVSYIELKAVKAL